MGMREAMGGDEAREVMSRQALPLAATPRLIQVCLHRVDTWRKAHYVFHGATVGVSCCLAGSCLAGSCCPPRQPSGTLSSVGPLTARRVRLWGRWRQMLRGCVATRSRWAWLLVVWLVAGCEDVGCHHFASVRYYAILQCRVLQCRDILTAYI